MPIPFTCPHCGVTTQVDGQYAGQTGPCASCGTAVTIPTTAPNGPQRRSNGCLVAVIVAAVLAPVLIIVVAMGSFLVLPVIHSASNEATDMVALTQIAMLGGAVESYNLDVNTYPTTEQGLEALR